MPMPPVQNTLTHDEADELATEAIALVRTWLCASANEPVDAAAARLAGLLRDPDGLAFAVGFIDQVVRPEDLKVAARNLRRLASRPPRFLGRILGTLVRIGGALAPVLPSLVVGVSRGVLRSMVRHLIIDATPQHLGAAIARIRRTEGVRLNVNLLGEAILGREEAARRLAGTRELLERGDVDYVSIKVSATVAPHTPWAFDEAVADAVSALRPLLRAGAETSPRTFINLDMEEYKDLELTLAVFTRLLDEPEFLEVSAGIVLQAYLPDALQAMQRLQQWARARLGAGGAPIKVRVVKGANLPMERVDAELHGWPLATWATKQQSDSSYKAVIEYGLRPEHVQAVRIGVAGHNLFDVAFAWTLAARRGVADAVDVEMLLGMAPAQAAAVRRTVGSILLYTPVVHPTEFDVAIAYLIRRLEEGASQENFMSAVFELDNDERLFARERQRFLASLMTLPTSVPPPNRRQDRMDEAPVGISSFVSTADSDPSLLANQRWAGSIRSRMEHSGLGAELAATRLSSVEEIDHVVTAASTAARNWQDLGPRGRAGVLHRAGALLEQRRAELLEVMGSECGKVIEQSDPEVSEAIDFAHYYAEAAVELDRIPGARAVPVDLTVVTPPWNFPVAIPAGSTFAALAAGSAVVLKPARQAARCAAVLAEILWEAGVPREVLAYVLLSQPSLGAHLVGHPLVKRVILTGSWETAETFRGFRADLDLLAETSGKNAIVVTPSADLDLAARDIALSAFGHAGQKCSAASLVVLVGSVASSRRFRRQLLDAVESYQVGWPWQGSSRVGPLIGPAEGKLLDALTTLAPGESWLLAPRRLDSEGKLWTPGIRDNVAAGSKFHHTEYFGPVLGIMTAADLEEATAIVNQVDFGLTSGLHSLDDKEIDYWLANVEAGNLYLNRGITGAIVQRQPFGGWKRSAVGTGTKAGGPHYLLALTDWVDDPLPPTPRTDDHSAAALEVAVAIDAAPAEQEWLAAALDDDRRVWAEDFHAPSDPSGLVCEQNPLRYQAVPVTIRAEGGSLVRLIRVVSAGVRAGSRLVISLAGEIPPPLVRWLDLQGVASAVEDAGQWAARVAVLAGIGGRIRLLEGDRLAVAEACSGSPAVAVHAGEVLSSGRIEGLVFLREQSVSVTAHRFGTPVRREVPALGPVR